MKLISTLLIVVGLVVAGMGFYIMFILVPEQVENSTFPEDYDDHFVYGGYVESLDTGSGKWGTTNFSVDRHVEVVGKNGSDMLILDTHIWVYDNETGDHVEDLEAYQTFEMNKNDRRIEYVTTHDGYEEYYRRSRRVHHSFPQPVEKKEGEGYRIWNMNIKDWSVGMYQGTESRGGVDCYVFYGNESNYEVEIPEDLKSQLPEGSTMEVTLWEKAWVHPLTGAIVDYAKEVKQYLYLPELPEVPEIVYPSDLNSTTGFTGELMLFDQETAMFNTYDNISAERNIEATGVSGYDLTVNELVNVTYSNGTQVDRLNSNITVKFDTRTGIHSGMGRSGHYLFPPTGVEMENYTIWDEGYGMNVTAVYTGTDEETFAPLDVYIYHIFEENISYPAGGNLTLDMTYYVEPQTGIVLNVDKEVWNWMEQERRLPTDTDQINKTVHLNATINTVDPLDPDEPQPSMDIYITQDISCHGFQGDHAGTALIEETVTRYFTNDTMISSPVTARFGVDAYTMEYIYVEGWSNEEGNRTGVFTFPVGLRNDTGDVIGSFMMYNSDLGTSLPVVLSGTEMMNGMEIATYEMMQTDIALDHTELTMALGKDPGLPGATGLYDCHFTYEVDVYTGTLINVSRETTISIVPPDYEFLYKNLDSTIVMEGDFGGQDLIITQHTVGTDLAPGIALINITTTADFENGTPFLPVSYSEFPINISSHEVLFANLSGTRTYWTFPEQPTDGAPYPMMMSFAGMSLNGLGALDSEGDGVAVFRWTNHTMIDGGLLDPGMSGVHLPTNLTYIWDVDSFSGAVLNVTMMLDVYVAPMMVFRNFTFVTTHASNETMALSNQVISWALMGTPVDVLMVEADLYEAEKNMAIKKAQDTSQLLLIGDGLKPAMHLSLTFNATTRAMMIGTAQATIEQLELLPQLQKAHALDDLLKANDNMVVFAYYKQVWEKVDIQDSEGNEIDGSVDYWGEYAKEKDDKVHFMGTTVPLIFYGIGILIIIAGIVLMIVNRVSREEDKEEEEGGTTYETGGEDEDKETVEEEDETSEE